MHQDKRYYEIAKKELESDAPRPGLWAKAYAESSGNETAARALYIKLRAEQLIGEVRSEAPAQERAKSRALMEKLDIDWEPVLILLILLALGYWAFLS